MFNLIKSSKQEFLKNSCFQDLIEVRGTSYVKLDKSMTKARARPNLPNFPEDALVLYLGAALKGRVCRFRPPGV